jgi:hypothetical protein
MRQIGGRFAKAERTMAIRLEHGRGVARGEP